MFSMRERSEHMLQNRASRWASLRRLHERHRRSDMFSSAGFAGFTVFFESVFLFSFLIASVKLHVACRSKQGRRGLDANSVSMAHRADNRQSRRVLSAICGG